MGNVWHNPTFVEREPVVQTGVGIRLHLDGMINDVTCWCKPSVEECEHEDGTSHPLYSHNNVIASVDREPRICIWGARGRTLPV
jgi:hypothetical protein